MEWIYAITALLNVLAAILAWMTSRRWKRKHLQATSEITLTRNQQIEALKNELETLRNFVPVKISKYFLTIKQRLEAHKYRLQSDLTDTQSELRRVTHEISTGKEKKIPF